MANEEAKKDGINALGAKAAYNLANVTKTKPQYGALTPKWLTKFLEFKGLETGIYRVNKVKEGETPLDVLRSQTKKSDIIPQGYVEYETEPREYVLNSISTIVNVNTAIEDVYSAPYDQVQEQLGLAIESLRERQESQLIKDFLFSLCPDFLIPSGKGLAHTKKSRVIQQFCEGRRAIRQFIFFFLNSFCEDDSFSQIHE